MLSYMENGERSFSLMTDGWTSYAVDSYLSLTAHYMTANFEIKFTMVNCFHMKSSHTAANIEKELSELFSQLNVPTSIPIVYVVTNNAYYIKTAVENVNWNRLSCFVHTLRLIIHDAKNSTPGVEATCKKSWKIVNHYSRSTSARERLLEKQ
ncbi:hypothetical protein PR048_023862 [Dryococelus australis]|uniref:Uncharacterized protein n=1 Tax=Dryococelus australis TaxID=614101 RepID=A0ABQ9GVB8_9NEOP|nr:hypothetical protein PR048_023862 [Dryococelus australis]